MITTISPDEIAKFERLAAEWWNPDGAFKPLHRFNPPRLSYIREKVIHHFGDIRGRTLLDVGCGGGLLAEPLARQGATVTGIDASERNIAIACHHARQTGVTIEYRAAAAETLAQEGKTFDVVITMEVVEHVADVPAFLSACAALVKPGGLLFMATMNRTAKAWLLAIAGTEYVLRWLPKGTHQWSRFVKPSEAAGVLTSNGLRIEAIDGMTYNPFNGQWRLSRDVDVNYVMVACK
jgi:2-polyprenyl-6-hydroxyphenyl methylase/3-demethylubiquinone-9 3-methyltransferase